MNLSELLYNAEFEATYIPVGESIFVIEVSNEDSTYFKIHRDSGWVMETEFPNEPYVVVEEFEGKGKVMML